MFPKEIDEFADWWETTGSHYEAAVIANGDKPWTDSMSERRELWERRYTRPAPPAGMYRDPRKPEHEITAPTEELQAA